MDFDALVNEIANRVAAKIEQSESCAAVVQDDRPRLLILTQQHGDNCHAMLESPRLLEYYQTECALLHEYNCDPAAYEAVILFQLTIDALCKIADGVCDTPYTALAQKLLLLGKKIFIPCEEIELYRYKSTAPHAYYARLESRLNLLRSAGVTICKMAGLEDTILNGETQPSSACVASLSPALLAEESPAAPAETKKTEASISKKVITEKDMVAACSTGVVRIYVRQDAIVTDLAREYAHPRGIEILRK